MEDGADLLLSFLIGVGEGGQCGLGERCPGRSGPHVRRSAVSELFSYISGEDDRPGFNHDFGGDALSVPQGLGIGSCVGVELWELVGEFSKETYAGALEAADSAQK